MIKKIIKISDKINFIFNFDLWMKFNCRNDP